MYLSAPPTTSSTSTRPARPGANAFYAMMDRYLGELDALGCVIALTADHGMNAKTGMDAKPDVIYLQDLLDGWLGARRRG
jgi:phosphonoacetate hydrolase